METSFSARNVARRIVPITRFNRGEASKVFEEVAAVGTKVVLKNNVPAGYILSPAEFDRLTEMAENYELLMEAQTRLAHGESACIPEADVMKELGISEEELAGADEVDIG